MNQCNHILQHSTSISELFQHLFLTISFILLLIFSRNHNNHFTFTFLYFITTKFHLLLFFILSSGTIGIGYGQVISTGIVATYYVTIMAITLHYFFNSFKSTLPWTECLLEWGDHCTASSRESIIPNALNQTLANRSSSAELYYV